MYWKTGKEKKVQCILCPHRCHMEPDQVGICGVRKNIRGKLLTLNYGKLSSIALDPIEKKPIHFFQPGTQTLSIGSFGCNFFCEFCQNYSISKCIPETFSMTPEDVVNKATAFNVPSISYTYNEPTVFYEMVTETARLAKQKGLKNILVTNGYIEEEPRQEWERLMDAVNVDLKGFSQERYPGNFGGHLEKVKESILAYQKAMHLELTILVVPGMNDLDGEIQEGIRWIAKIDPKIPIHLNRYYPTEHYREPATNLNDIRKLYNFAKEHLDNVRCGNL